MPVGQPVQDGVQTLKIAWYHDRSPLNIFGTFVKRRDQNASSLRRNAIKGLCHERRADFILRFNTQMRSAVSILSICVHPCFSFLLPYFMLFNSFTWLLQGLVIGHFGCHEITSCGSHVQTAKTRGGKTF